VTRLAAALLAASLPAAAIEPELLKKLATHQDTVARWMRDGTFKVALVADELDSDGKPKKHVESVRRVGFQNGERVTTVLSATEDGKDVTAEEQKKQAEREAKLREKKEKPKSNVTSPFSAESQQDLFFWSPGVDPRTGLLRIAFRPKGARSDEVLEGEALVDPARGEPVRIAMKPSKMPTFVDEMDVELRFDAVVDGVRMLSSLRVAGAGGFAFIKKRGTAVTTFSEHAMPPSSAAK
jgi:hypothetical protein